MADHFTEYDGGNGRVIAGPGTGKTTGLGTGPWLKQVTNVPFRGWWQRRR